VVGRREGPPVSNGLAIPASYCLGESKSLADPVGSVSIRGNLAGGVTTGYALAPAPVLVPTGKDVDIDEGGRCSTGDRSP